MAAKDPGNRIPAPGRLRLVQTFVNSVDREHAVDDFAEPAGLAAWLVEQGLWPRARRVTRAELADAVCLREALRAILLANNTGDSAEEALATLDQIAAGLPVVIRLSTGVLEPTVTGVPGALARLLAVVHAAMVDGSWASLKACQADICQWAYYDRSHNKSSQWCSMSLCGARAKMRAYRKRAAVSS